ncbi:hypothetical protein FA15DRAFT_675732 [Coprinopsis marcescibilis]|uniref:Chromo domain-containing protein n=1 Tax=Coprinopsis marcescibilis TaxID=230819 RepID=A0A5C3KD41_COPMA|nr:hypothetical protein FA15DRAFT_675732 [Coprinopsis marcescibilis]
MARGASVESSDAEANQTKAAVDVQSEGATDEEEYEIEEILDASRGRFPNGRLGFYCSWKGYGPEDNSWVDEKDANAGDLVEIFWAKNPKKAERLLKPKKSRQSTGGASAASASAGKKRGRKYQANDESDEELREQSQPTVKKAKKTTTNKSASSTRREETADPVASEIGDMNQYMHVADWETLVKTVDTVERGDDSHLVIYFTLHNGQQVREKSDICKERFPQALLEFYENNLRWKVAEDD